MTWKLFQNILNLNTNRDQGHNDYHIPLIEFIGVILFYRGIRQDDEYVIDKF